MKSKKKILVVLGTRPEAIKLKVLIQELKKRHDADVYICSSGQHREMLDSVLCEFNITPDYELGVMRKDQTLASLTSLLTSELDGVMEELCPDTLIVQGDTTTALCGALAAFYRAVPIAHVEAGLRSQNIRSPFPEEFNRRTISSIATLHFAPTYASARNLLCEGVAAERIFTVGNTVIDMLQRTQGHAPDLRFSLNDKDFALVTLHRREHSEHDIENILASLRELSKEIRIILPMHKNPRVRSVIERELSGIDEITLCEPLGLKDFHFLMRSCYMILTDSGGIQEEATFLGKPTLVLRNTTERPEGVGAGALRLVGTECESILEEAHRLLYDQSSYAEMSVASNIFGDGHASEKIADVLLNF